MDSERVMPGPKPGYKQSPEHVAKRIKRGEEHPNWKGDAITERSGRSRALRAYPPGPCVICGDPAERHHINGNTADNSASNIAMLCHYHHMTVDGRLAAWVAQAKARIADTTTAAASARRSRMNCLRGHELSGSNLYITPAGRRVCRTCRATHKARSRARKAGL